MTEKEYRTKFARSGGLARAKSLTAKERAAFAKKAAAARWNDGGGNSQDRRKARRMASGNGVQ